METQYDVVADSKGRISLGLQHAGQRYIIIQDQKGVVILERAVLIPERELWLHKNEDAKKSVLKGLKQAKQKRLKRFDLDDK